MPKTILLREDDQDLARLVCELLEDADYRVVHVTTVEELLRQARQWSPCVALVDGMNPAGFDLWWLGGALKKMGIPAVAFTAHASAVQEFESDRHGFAGVIAKPFEADEFLEAVNAICWDEPELVAS